MTDVKWLMMLALFLGPARLSGQAAGPTHYLLDTWQVQNGLPDNEVLALAQSADGFLWLATRQGLARFDGTAFQPSSREQLAELGRGHIVALRVDSADRIWAALEDGSLLCGRGGRLEAVTTAQGAPAAGVHGIYSDAQRRIILSDRQGEIFRTTAETLTPWLDARGAAPGTFVGINVDLAGVVWVRHGNVLSWWAGDHWASLKAPEDWTDFFALKTGAARQGGMWIGGRDGLQRFHDGQWQESQRRFPQPLPSIQLIMEDSWSQVWVTTGSGHLFCFDSEGQLRQFEFSRRFGTTPLRHLLEDDEGNLWAAAQGAGLIRFQPVIATNSQRPPSRPLRPRAPRIVVDEVWADSRLIMRAPWPPAGAVVATTNRVPAPVLRIPVGVEVITIRYSVLSLSQRAGLRRQCRLEDVDHDWVDAGAVGVVRYTNLPPRQYRFLVRATSDAPDRAEGSAALAFAVARPFWQSWPFRFGAAAAILGGLFWGYHVRVSALERQRTLQRSFSRRLIESQETERQRIAADLHDSLGQKLLVIKNDAQFGLLSRGAPDVLADQLQRVSDTAAECLEEIRHIARNLRPYQLDQMGLTKAIRSLISQVERAGLKWEQVDMDDVDGLLAPALEINLYRVIQEACGNILRHASASSATLRMERRGPELLLSISDNGRGFDVRNSQTPGPQPGGFGLTGMRERVAILGGQLDVQSSAGRGTTLLIKLPIHSEPHEPDHSDRR